MRVSSLLLAVALLLAVLAAGVEANAASSKMNSLSTLVISSSAPAGVCRSANRAGSCLASSTCRGTQVRGLCPGATVCCLAPEPTVPARKPTAPAIAPVPSSGASALADVAITAILQFAMREVQQQLNTPASRIYGAVNSAFSNINPRGVAVAASNTLMDVTIAEGELLSFDPPVVKGVTVIDSGVSKHLLKIRVNQVLIGIQKAKIKMAFTSSGLVNLGTKYATLENVKLSMSLELDVDTSALPVVTLVPRIISPDFSMKTLTLGGSNWLDNAGMRILNQFDFTGHIRTAVLAQLAKPLPSISKDLLA